MSANLGKYYNYPEHNPYNNFTNPEPFYFDERFIPITSDIIDGIYDWYLVSNYGKVYHKYEDKFLHHSLQLSNPDYDKNNYYHSVSLYTIYGSKNVRVHRLVISCFYPELGPITQKLDVNHKNGNTEYNYISINDPNDGNIEWMTHKENILHAYRTGLHHVGEDNVHSIISNETAKKIIELLATNKYTSKEIVSIVGGNSTVHIVDDIRKKEAWAHLSEGIDFYQRPKRIVDDDMVHFVCKYFEDHSPRPEGLGINDLCREALKSYGIEPTKDLIETFRKVYAHKHYVKISSQYNF